jgi:hypothetical protein
VCIDSIGDGAVLLGAEPVDYGDVVDIAETAEGLKDSIRAHEAERIKLLGELRVAETQGNVSGIATAPSHSITCTPA